MKTLSFVAAAALAVTSSTAMAGNVLDAGTTDAVIMMPDAPVGSSAGSLGAIGSLGSLGAGGTAIAAGVIGLAVVAAAVAGSDSAGGTAED